MKQAAQKSPIPFIFRMIDMQIVPPFFLFRRKEINAGDEDQFAVTAKEVLPLPVLMDFPNVRSPTQGTAFVV
jgi:hypothetical protein